MKRRFAFYMIFWFYRLWLTHNRKDHKRGGKFVHNFSMERSALAVFMSILLVIVSIVRASLSGFA